MSLNTGLSLAIYCNYRIKGLQSGMRFITTMAYLFYATAQVYNPQL
jgi:hypothetical protein